MLFFHLFNDIIVVIVFIDVFGNYYRLKIWGKNNAKETKIIKTTRLKSKIVEDERLYEEAMF